ncbi:hypothetical protein KCU65_g2265, partial [Aureobasidium melanogenum]
MAHQERLVERDMFFTDTNVSRRPSTQDGSDLDQQPPSPAERLISSNVDVRGPEVSYHTSLEHATSETAGHDDDAGHKSMTDTDYSQQEAAHADCIRAYTPWSLRRDVLLEIKGLPLHPRKSATSGNMAPLLASIFTILAVYWAHLEYRVRVLMPWKLMCNKLQPAKQSVLLDYVSPMQPVVLISSARVKHWPVFTAAVGSMVIVAMTVVSTSLFVLEHMIYQQDQVPMSVSNRINDSSFDQSVIDSSPVLSALAIASGNLSMQYPLGTNQQYATDVFTTFSQTDGIPSLRTATVNVTTSDLDCHKGNIIHSQFLAEENYLQVNVSDGSCQSGQLNVTVANSNDTTSWLFQTTTSCPNDVTQMILGFVKFKIPPYTGSDQFMDETVNRIPRAMNSSSINSTVLFCEPKYSFENADVTLNSTSIEKIKNPKPPASASSSLGSVMSGQLMLDSFQRALMNAKVSINSMATDFDVLLDALLAVSSIRKVDRYENATNLEVDTRQLYSAVCAQIVHQYMRANTSDTVMGTQWVERSRLVLNELSLRLLEAGIVILIVSAIIISLIRPSVVGLGGLPTLERVSAILARSDAFETALEGRGTQGAGSMAKHLASGLYSVECSRSLTEPALCVHGSFPASEGAATEKEDGIKWWLPFALGRYTRWAIAIVPLLLIAALEITYHFSLRPHGLGCSEQSAEYSHYTWTLLPGSIMTTLKLLQQSLTFSVELLDPFLELKRGSAAANRTLMSAFLACNALQICFRSVRTQRFAVLSIAFSTLLTPFLTIITSGLYVSQPVTAIKPTFVTQVDRLLFPSDVNVSTCADWSSDRLLAANLLIKESVPYPNGTFGDLVLPTLELLINGSVDSRVRMQDATSLMANVTALRPNFICEPLDPSDFRFDIGKHVLNGLDWKLHNYTAMNYTHAKFGGCACRPGSFPSLSKSFNMYNEPGQQPFAVYEYNPSWTCTGLDSWQDSDSLIRVYNDTPAACPNITLVHTNITAHPPTMIGVACRYRIEQVPANLTFALREGTPTDAQPIGEAKVLDGYTPRCLQNPTDFEQIMDPSSLTGYSYARLMLAALNGSDPSTTLTSENLPVLVNRVTQICNTYTTQYFSDKLRGNLTVAATVPATLSGSATRACVYQDRTSTTVLEVLLAVIFICTITALWLFDAEHLLPQSPCSIAAQASLLAGAEFLRLIPPGSQILSNTKMAQVTPFKDHLFSIGWWTQEDGTRRFGIGVGQAETEEQCKGGKTVVNVTDVELGEADGRSMDHEQEQSSIPLGQVQTGFRTD